MANMIRVKISGLDEIQRRLESELPERAKAMLRAGLKEGAKVMTQSFERMKKTAVYKIIESLRKAVGLS